MHETDVQDFKPEDIFNMDETGLFFRQKPLRSLAKEAAPGNKMNKERITVALTANSTGSERLRLLIINKSARPRCFGKTFKPASFVDYHSNSKAWMNGEVSPLQIELC